MTNSFWRAIIANPKSKKTSPRNPRGIRKLISQERGLNSRLHCLRKGILKESTRKNLINPCFSKCKPMTMKKPKKSQETTQ
jgi:hypothetical protein